MEVSQRRKSVFREVGLDDCESARPTKRHRPSLSVRINSTPEVHIVERFEVEHAAPVRRFRSTNNVDRVQNQRYPSAITADSPIPPIGSWFAHRMGALALCMAALVPLLYSASFSGHKAVPLNGVNGGVIPEEAKSRLDIDLERRDDSPTNACFRWAQQSALVNGTLYLYGGEATTETQQDSNTWNNDFLTLDLTTNWSISSPTLTGLSQPDGPPAVSLGYLWNSHESLFLYGGEFSWKPPVAPTTFSTWEYSISSQSWIEHSGPTTSSGNNAPSNGDAVQRAAEGAGANVPSLGRGFYFGGHQDGYTTEAWDQSIPRIYLQSLLEYTFPGYSNDQVQSLENGQTASDDGVYRNITEGGLQDDAGFTERADGLLVFVPGFGDLGILLALAGGTNESFTQMNVVDVYDIATSTWYHQSTSGPTPKIRVNPCAVVAAAPDGSSYNVYMFGGQNLVPYGDQTQYDDMWILTVPSFTWIEVDQSDQSVPYGRSGASCNIWDGQMVMVGGYVGSQLSCETPGIYVYDLSNLQWTQQFTALSGDPASSGESPSSPSASDNPFDQQPAQVYNSTSPGGLEGSYGYLVPDVVVSVIGGDANGGATQTLPVVEVTAGPLKTGKPVTYTVTQSAGATATETGSAGNGGGGNTNSSGGGGPNIAAIVIGIIAGLLFALACYLAFCAYVYRKQVQMYKRHIDMQGRGEKIPAMAGLADTDSSNQGSSDRRFGFSIFKGNSDQASHTGSNNNSSGVYSGVDGSGSSGRTGYQQIHVGSRRSSTEDLLGGQEPTFVGVMLNPRRSLRVINRD